MEYQCEVVVVNTKNGPVRVNKSDYDADPKAWGGKVDDKATEEAAAAPPPSVNTGNENAPAQYFVSKEGRKFFVFNLTGEKAGDLNGYKTEDEAKEAIKGL